MELLPIEPEQRLQVQEFQRKHRIGLLTLFFSDIVGSTELKQRWGDPEAIAMIQGHHALVREILNNFKEGELISTAGDSCFLVFAKPSDAVKFSLLLQAKLRARAIQTGKPLFDRIGIHVGEVLIEEAEGGPKPRDLYGIQVDTCARIMSLGKENQILVTRFAFDSARQVLRGQDLNGVGALSWLNHGPYLLKGVEEPLEICEVGETGKAQLSPPASSEKGQRFASPNAEPVLGWRPAIGQTVPGTKWVLQEKLGEGGFGEVWLGLHEILKETKVFKFCFRADRVRSLKREVTLFRLLKERVGHHPNIMGVDEVYFDAPPYYIAMDYAGGKDLISWCAGRGGAGKIPLAVRLEIISQIAEGLEAAHEAGVIHRDIKPSNILLIDQPKGGETIQVKLSDFGIGQIVSAEALEGITRMGFTQTMISSSSSQTGTLLYMAPELIGGKQASPQSDIYSIGVLLYQLLMGDFSRPLTMDWIRNVDDSLLRDDLVKCFAGDPKDRFQSAGDLARNLRGMESRNAARVAEEASREARRRQTYLTHLLGKAALVSVVVAALLAGGFYFFHEFGAGKYAAIEIHSLPEGAEVWLKGNRVGSTPYRAVHLSPGEFSCTLRLPDYEASSSTLALSPRENKLTVALAPLRAVNQSTSSDTNVALLAQTNLTQIVATAPSATVLTKMGRVEITRRGTQRWITAETNMVLFAGDVLRTGAKSRSTIQFSDGGVFKINELTSMEIAPARTNSYLFHREAPTEIKIRTPNISGTIRG